MPVAIRRRRILEYKINAGVVTVVFSRTTTRNGGTVKIPNKTVTPTGADTGTEFTFDVDPPAEPNEILDIAFSPYYFGDMGEIYARPLKNTTVPDRGYVGNDEMGYPVIDDSYILSLLGN